MDFFQKLGVSSIAFLVAALALAVYALTGNLSRRRTFLVSGTVLALMIVVTVLCLIIYLEYVGLHGVISLE